jgi:DNA polymerase-3 subunit gamma/tau
MSYLVLARKHRPQAFDEVVGQEHITDLLKKTFNANRLTHAYLFCGPRGIGKTSCARILAKSLNCEKGPTLNPCGQCSACQEIAKGTSFDVLEIDGASNRGIDEIRTLRENVKFAPSHGKYKIYIVDEVHMLTAEAFNALLKTLEEPPQHVKFIFATTAPNKVPATIISRCQRFDFKRISIKTIVELLTDVSKKEKLKIDQDALYAIGKSAQGSLRDALSILDQLSALSESGIHSEDVCSMLGLVETQLLFELADALSEKNCSLSLQILENIIDKGKDIKQLSKDITEHFRHLMVIKVGGKALGRLVDYPVEIKEMLLTQCQRFSLQEILKAIDVLIESQETARIIESTRMPLEIAFAKLTYQEQSAGAENASPALQPSRRPAGAPVMRKANVLSPATVLRDKKGQVDISGPQGPSGEEDGNILKDEEESADLPEDIANNMDKLVVQELGHVEETEAGPLDLDKIKKAWDALTHGVSREKMSVATYLQEGVPYQFEGGTLTVAFPLKCRFQKESLEDSPNVKLVERIFSEKLKSPVIIKYTIVEDCEPPVEAENIKDALNIFKGKVDSRWHDEPYIYGATRRSERKFVGVVALGAKRRGNKKLYLWLTQNLSKNLSNK